MTMAARGYAKLAEELGELTQVVGKRLAYWDNDAHWDGSNITDRMVEEMGDVIAAIQFVCERNGIDPYRVLDRWNDKVGLFRRWEVDEGNNAHGIDGGTS